MKKGILFLLSALTFTGVASASVTSCASTTTDVIKSIATIKIVTHGDLVTATIENAQEKYQEGDSVKLNLQFVEGYDLEEVTLNGEKVEDINAIKLTAGTNLIDIYVKSVSTTEGSTNIRDFVFEEIEGGAAYAITSYTPTGIYPSIATIPSTYLGKPVKELKYVTEDKLDPQGNVIDTIVKSRYSFGGLQGVSLPDSIVKIDSRVFRNNSSLKSITVSDKNEFFATDGVALFNKNKTELKIFPQGVAGEYKVPDSVNKIGNDAFYGAAKLTKLDLNKVVVIGDNAFNSLRNLKEIVLPDTVTTLGEGAFSQCVDTEKVTLSKNLKEIPVNGFYKNSSLKEIHIPGSVKSILTYGFYDCTSLSKVTFENGVTRIGDYSFSHNLLTELNIPGSVKSIGKAAFSGCNLLSKVTLNEGLESIDNNVFYQDLAIESINIPGTVKTIGTEVFHANLSLKAITVNDTNTNYKDIDGVLFDSNDTLIAYPSAKDTNIVDRTYKIPSTTKALGFRCFSAVSYNPQGNDGKAYSITKVFIPKSVKSMNESFYLALIDSADYEGTKAEFDAIDTHGLTWDANATDAIKLTCLGDVK